MPLALALALSLAAPALDLPAWNTERLRTQGVGLSVLGGWAVTNLAVGAVGAALAQDDRVRWLFLGSLLWNTVNLGLSVAGLASQWGADPASFDAKQSLQASSSSATVYWINAGLDLAYLGTAAFLWQRGDGGGDARMVGIGQALLVQGAFLLVFDVVMALLQGGLTSRLLAGVDVAVSQAPLATGVPRGP
jgi:hypothetical protein